ncbi:MAG: hypothetical protein K5804_17780 [Microbacterium sp.]|uniref:hypothetical protein n=1 Tax=Microbacterium sp. TaxID=51671 RepID=UPI002604757A|nr:hypothetical protein [Microbacterium sp.]MCV0420095.1 hypothetical protein [Microbacterium sp.]
MTINDELLAELEAAANAATPGPWNYDGSYVCTMRQEDGTVYVESWNPIADALLTKNVHYISTANPATILALLQHVRELTADANKFREIVCAVVREIPHRDTSRGNAPGHGHSIAGVWDEDNGALAGTECAWCKTWHSAVDAARSSAD